MKPMIRPSTARETGGSSPRSGENLSPIVGPRHRSLRDSALLEEKISRLTPGNAPALQLAALAKLNILVKGGEEGIAQHADSFGRALTALLEQSHSESGLDPDVALYAVSLIANLGRDSEFVERLSSEVRQELHSSLCNVDGSFALRKFAEEASYKFSA